MNNEKEFIKFFYPNMPWLHSFTSPEYWRPRNFKSRLKSTSQWCWSIITQIHYTIPLSGRVRFELRNALGLLVNISEENGAVGNNTIDLNTQVLTYGVYFYTIEFNKQRITRKMIVNQ